MFFQLRILSSWKHCYLLLPSFASVTVISSWPWVLAKDSNNQPMALPKVNNKCLQTECHGPTMSTHWISWLPPYHMIPDLRIQVLGILWYWVKYPIKATPTLIKVLYDYIRDIKWKTGKNTICPHDSSNSFRRYNYIWITMHINLQYIYSMKKTAVKYQALKIFLHDVLWILQMLQKSVLINRWHLSAREEGGTTEVKAQHHSSHGTLTLLLSPDDYRQKRYRLYFK